MKTTYNSFTKNNTDKITNIIIPKYEDNNKSIMKEIINYEYIPKNILNTKRSRNIFYMFYHYFEKQYENSHYCCQSLYN